MAARTPKPSAAVEAARQRRVGAAAARTVRMEWFVKEVANKVSIAMKARVRMATTYLRDKIVQNISTPVVKGTGPRGGRVITGRSKQDEFPHVETGQLMRTLMMDVQETQLAVWDGFVGTPLDYGLQLEARMRRSFLVRTHNENLSIVRGLLTGPIA